MHRTYAPGDTIFRQGELGSEMYVIHSGAVEIVREKDGREVKLATIKDRDDFFGEMALFSREPRSATARAVRETMVEVVSRSEFRNSIQNPLAWRMLERMSERLRKTDEAIEDLGVQDQSRKEHLGSIVSRYRESV